MEDNKIGMEYNKIIMEDNKMGMEYNKIGVEDNIIGVKMKNKGDRVFIKSNKDKKIELKNLEKIDQIYNFEDLDPFTKLELGKIKNIIFKNNIFDIEEKKIVSSIRIVKTSILGRQLTPMIWEYYKNRGNLDVNQVIKLQKRENLIINYSLNPNYNNKKEIIIK